MMTSMSDDSSTHLYEPTLSPGSSVSTQLQEEYDELLKYAVVVPSFDPNAMTRTLADRLGSFPQPITSNIGGRMELIDSREFERDEEEDENEEDDDTEVEDQSNAGAEHQDHHHDNQEPPVAPREHRVAFSNENSGNMDDIDSLTGEQIGSGPIGRTLGRLSTMPMGDPLATKLFMRPEADSSRSSVSGYSDALESEASYSVTIDQDIGRMEGLLDTWTGNLKRNIMAEFGQAKIKLISHHKQQSQKLKEKHAMEKQRIQSDMDNLRELLHTYEQSIERKDQVIANLTRALQKQREKFDMMRTFSEWKIKHNENKHECMASKLAEKHYYRSLMHKCWDAWHAVIQSRWRDRVEKACQAKAQEVCMQLTNDYEAKLAALNEELEAARTEVSRLHTERENYGETMKKAFMRGVCALNLEAMTMFQDQDGRESAKNGVVPPDQPMPMTGPGDMPMEDFFRVTIPQEPVYSSDPPGAPPPRVVTSQAAGRGPIVGNKAITNQAKTSGKTKSKVVTAKISAQAEPRVTSTLGGSQGLAPPMSSVVVERHQPVVKQTVGHATASRYVRASDSISQTGNTKPVIVQRKIAGQAAPNLNIQTVKLVE